MSHALRGLVLPGSVEAAPLVALTRLAADVARIVLPESDRIDLRGRRIEAFREPATFVQAGRRLRGWQLPVLVARQPLQGAIVSCSGAAAAIALQLDEDDAEAAQLTAAYEPVLRDFIIAALAVVEGAAQKGEPQAPGGFCNRVLTAGQLAELLLQEHGEANTPPKSLIVRHVEDDRLPDLAAPLARHPRRVLQRIRAQTPLARVTELDPACLRALVRAPGRTVAEKAGTRQTILAVARTDTVDTLENRVLRDFLERSAAEAARYGRVHARFDRSRRWRQVQAWGRAARAEAAALSEAGVRTLPPAVTPNYVLSNDARYRRIWAGWQELLKREQAEDEAWRWQRRLWADLARMFALSALIWSPPLRHLALAPIGIAPEQQRGRWTVPVGHLGAFVLPRGSGRSLILQLRDVEADEAAPALAHRLGTTFWVSITTTDGVERGAVAGWAAHAARAEQPGLDADVAAAEAAIDAADARGLRGMVLRSLPLGQAVASEARGPRSAAVAVPLGPDALAHALTRMSDLLLDLVSEIAP
jgi:hypothetical protein